MWRVTVSLVTICLLVQVKASPDLDISLEDLLDRLVTLEDWKRETEREVSTLRETVAQQGVIIKKLETELAIQANLTATLQSFDQDKHQNTQEHTTETGDDTASDVQVSNNRIRTTDLHKQVPFKPSTLSKRAIAGGVAFTAYLDHDLVHLGPKQTIKFNQLVTNDGNGYNTNSGVFTCPEAGVYHFTFFIGARGITGEPGQLTAELVVNNQLIVSAIVETTQIQQDLQGGNTAVVRLNQGDTVWVEETYSGEHVEGSTNIRLTTFTGVYLYA